MNWLAAALMLAAASTYQATSALAPAVRDLTPAPGTTVKAFFPELSATITVRAGQVLQRRSLRLFVDGRNVTASASIAGDTVRFVPHERMHAGWHDAFVEGADRANRTFSQAWVFRTEDPDIDLPAPGDGELAFFPVGLNGGPFTHFFLLSPFDGFALLQLCGFEFPMTRVAGTPVFFITVPATPGTILLGCSPGIVFTPFQAGIGQLNPIFFPIEVAGPGIFQNGTHHQPRRPPIPGTTTMPVYRAAPTMPVYRAVPTMPVYRAAPTMPVYRPRVPVPRAPVIGPARVPVRRPHAR